MKIRFLFILIGLSLLASSALAQNSTRSLTDVQKGFVNPPDDARIMMRWWWFGPAVTKAGIERELRTMKDAGIGGVEIQPIYPLALDDESKGLKNLRFLSSEFLDCLKFANDKARELGMRVDLTLGSGWPFGGPQVPITQAASKLRVERVKAAQAILPVPKINEGEKFIAAFAGRRELVLNSDGAIVLPNDLALPADVRVFIASRTRQQVKRAAFGGEGYVMDHYDRASLDNYLQKVGEPLLKAFGDKPPYAIFCDSLEVFSSDWSTDFLTEFQKRRGYDLKPLLPALAGEELPHADVIRQDWGRTLTELLEERFMAPLQQWAKQHHTRFRIQGYGIPPATIGSNQFADLTEGEGWQWKTVRASRWASSANHLFGRNITSSETWTWLHSPSFRATPLDMKAEADLHFLQGINQLIGHGWPYTPSFTEGGIEYPGWRLYAAAVFNEKNPWFIAMPEMSKYLQRLSYLMRQGQPANDVAFYLPNSDAWASFVNPKVHYMIEALKDRVGEHAVAQVLEAGFNLDFVDDETLSKLGKVEGGALAMGTNRYKVVVLPNVEKMPLATLQKLDEFSKQGGLVVATKGAPAMLPGYQHSTTEREQFKSLVMQLLAGDKPRISLVTDEQQLGSKLAALTQPDVQLTPAAPGIGFIHRRTPEADIYFLANSTNETKSVKAAFRVTTANAEQWSALDGTALPLEVKREANASHVTLNFLPYESKVIVFSRRKIGALPTLGEIVPPLDLSDQWRVTKGNETQGQNFAQLRSWSENQATRFYSGTMTYEKQVTISPTWLKSAQRAWLDFGEAHAIPETPRRNGMRAWLDTPIRDAAVIYLNGQRVGSLWCPPYLLDVTKHLKPGVNRLKIVVGNTAINHLAGTRLPDYKEVHQRYGERFQPQDMENLQPLPSGLLGKIRLVAHH